jgi:hypothetical protein
VVRGGDGGGGQGGAAERALNDILKPKKKLENFFELLDEMRKAAKVWKDLEAREAPPFPSISSKESCLENKVTIKDDISTAEKL